MPAALLEGTPSLTVLDHGLISSNPDDYVHVRHIVQKNPARCSHGNSLNVAKNTTSIGMENADGADGSC
ncbi:hypothetical protein GHK48_10325 [Sinorhizobium fredii]|uniref:Uncharacterized protein n=1 Tax=Rhizobium fredii TaxID=380 RepID=A0A844A8M4_RHIFR|nr:hypothetical protein [Sinorhizobium fredii]MQX08671.1 hypothetical protein [Sinorhizobium fredii]UTY49666.1 hypothetical protein EPK84_24360 [Sinorhizobium fredii]